jgi:hypothetical protein
MPKCPHCKTQVLVTHYGDIWGNCPKCGKSLKGSQTQSSIKMKDCVIENCHKRSNCDETDWSGEECPCLEICHGENDEPTRNQAQRRRNNSS